MKFTVYKIVNDIDNKVYIGSTRLTLGRRFSAHKYYHEKKKFPLYAHMQSLGIDHFRIEEIAKVDVTSARDAKKHEQVEIEKHDKSVLLNALRAHSENRDKTRDQDKKRKNRRDFYAKHRADPEWAEKERERNRLRMAKKRAEATKDK